MQYRNAIPVAAHRGNSKYYPENTMAAYRSAVEIKADMIEVDLHMTQDGHLVMMHDHRVDRTTNGTGLIREKTLEEIRSLDAGSWKDEKFKGEKVPTFEEFLLFMRDVPEMLLNVELKDYPADSGEFAYEAAKKAIARLKEEKLLSRCTINTWSGELNEWLHETYGREVQIHAYSPQELMGKGQKQFVYNYAYCVCLWAFGGKVADKQLFDYASSCGVEPWAYYPVDTEEAYDKSIENGVRLFTSNDPVWAMEYLRKKGLHE